PTAITRLRNSGGGSKVLLPPTDVAAQWKSCSRWPTDFSNNLLPTRSFNWSPKKVPRTFQHLLCDKHVLLRERISLFRSSRLHCMRILKVVVVTIFSLLSVTSLTAESASLQQARPLMRPANADQYVGSDTCAECHADLAAKFSVTAHRQTLERQAP